MPKYAKENRRTKIVCTLGPASMSEEVVTRLVEAGMNVARINFSHGTPEEKRQTIEMVRRVSEKTGRPVAVLQDLQGPKIRVRTFAEGSVLLSAGDQFTITNRDVPGTQTEVSTCYADLPKDLKQGDRFLLDDGLLVFETISVNETDVICRVIVGGRLSNHKGINLPGIRLSVPSLTRKDEEDLARGLEWGIDYVALSFVRTALDVIELKNRIKLLGHDTPVIAKLEKPEAIKELDDILQAADGVMVARGDLGVELPPEDVPAMQKKIISAANRIGRVVITATQMLESMIQNPRPTRAEVSDVANAVFDGTDAVMLSAETAAGKYPVEAVEMMDRICRRAEDRIFEDPHHPPREPLEGFEAVESAVALAAADGVDNLSVEGLAALTRGGRTALLCSKFRTRSYIWGMTPYEKIRRRMALYWGVRPMVLEDSDNIDALIGRAEELLHKNGLVEEGDIIAILGGMPLGQSGTTNFLKFHQVRLNDSNV